MLNVIGWLACVIPLGWISIACYFATVPTFGGAAFSGKWYHKIVGVIFWVIVAALWIKWLSVPTISIN